MDDVFFCKTFIEGPERTRKDGIPCGQLWQHHHWIRKVRHQAEDYLFCK